MPHLSDVGEDASVGRAGASCGLTVMMLPASSLDAAVEMVRVAM